MSSISGNKVTGATVGNGIVVDNSQGNTLNIYLSGDPSGQLVSSQNQAVDLANLNNNAEVTVNGTVNMTE